MEGGAATLSSKRKKKKRPLPIAGGDRRTWSDLPADPLRQILDLLPNLFDLFAFASTCRRWRSLAVLSLSRRPPLLLHPRAARLETPTFDPRHSRSRPSLLSPQTLDSGYCIGYSHGYLIFYLNYHFLIADAFSGEETHLPELRIGDHSHFKCIVTATLSSPRCKLLLFRSKPSKLLSWRPGDTRWIEERVNVAIPEIRCLISYKGRIFGMDSHGRLLVLELEPRMSIRVLKVEFSRGGEGLQMSLPYGEFGQHLVECDGELLLVHFYAAEEVMFARMGVYRLDFSSEEWKWAKVERLGDWCLFVDHLGCPVAARSTERWGGRSNCVYIVGPGCDAWSLIPVDGTLIDITTIHSPLCPTNSVFPRWPAPIWIYPSMLL